MPIAIRPPSNSRFPCHETLVNCYRGPLTPLSGLSKFTSMAELDFDQLLKDYKTAVDRWVDAIRAEEALANDDHSMVEMERWDDAGFKVDDAEQEARKSRDAYKDALREKNYGF